MSLSGDEVSPRVRTVVLVLAEASRLRALQLGGRVACVVKPRCSERFRCGQPFYAGQRVVETLWRPVTMGQVRWTEKCGSVSVFECGACSLEKILSRKPSVASELEESVMVREVGENQGVNP